MSYAGSISRSRAGSDAAPPPPPSPPPVSPTMPDPSSAKRPKPPQEAINEFWAKFTTKTPGKVIPQNNYTDIVANKAKKVSATTTQASYEEAAAMCRAKVAKIVKECRRINKKYRDPHFDLETDLKLYVRDCLESLPNAKDPDAERPGSDMQPQSVKRVGDIFDSPRFYIDGPTTNDVRQGRNGDCWLMAALCTLSNKKGLIEKLCVAHDQACGVYGFVFHRDGEWISEIVDDFLYLTKPDYDESFFDRILFDDIQRDSPEEAYRKIYQTNSGSLYFAQCQDPQETWLPLLEKCYAKAHGDYAAIEGGFGGEGIEDLTGGVTSEVWTSDILDKDHFWTEELLKVNDEFLFGCSTGVWGSYWGDRKGIVELHAYSVEKAVEIDGKRLLKLKNPWGKGEWNGPWSDGSKEWTPEWLQKLGHRFGDDGLFWIEYSDLLRKYQAFERTRLFGPEWRVTQTWTTLTVPWTLDYHDTHFSFRIAEPGPVVIVLAQLDDRYFRGLAGQYRFELGFRVHKAGQEDYIVRSQTPYRMTRSVNVELDLEAGEYEVRVKINAARDQNILPIEDVIRKNAKDRRDKLIRIGLAYDLSHSKGLVVETSAEKKAREAHDKEKKDKKKAESKKKILADREEQQYLKIKQWTRDQKKHQKKKEKKKAKLAEKKARKAAKAAEKQKEADAKAEQEAKVQTEPKTDNEPETKKETGTEEEPAVKIESEGKAAVIADIKGQDTEEKDTAPSDEKKDDTTTSPDTSDEKPVTQSEKPVIVKTDDDGKVTTESSTDEETKSEAKDEAVKVATDSETKPAEEESKPTTQEEQEECESESEDDDLSSVGSLSELSERELEIQIKALNPPEQPADPVAADEEPDEFEKDPWNAVAVVGLRVYYKAPGEGKSDDMIKLNVVRPNPYVKASEGDKDKTESKDCKTRGLDVDDSAKDATLEGEVKDRKKSIMGDSRKADEAS